MNKMALILRFWGFNLLRIFEGFGAKSRVFLGKIQDSDDKIQDSGDK